MATTPKIPDLPPVGADAGEIDRFLRAVREIVQTREGRRGDALDKGVTFRELVDLGMVSRQGAGGWYYTGTEGPQGIPGIQGPPGDPYVPDYTPPPQPTGLIAVSTFRSALIEWDAPVYTQGHGNAYTKIYVAQYSGTGALPTFADATYAGQVGGSSTVYTHPAASGAQLHIWVSFVTADDVEGDAAGDINGFSITIGKVGNIDMGPLSVAAENLAAYAVDATKFASGIEPVGVVAALPNPVGYTGPKTLLRSTDGKIYRWVQNAWTAGVDGQDIFANSITAGQVSVGGLAAGAIAVGSAAIAVGAIRNALIENAAVDNAKIANVSAAKLIAGSIAVGEYIQSTGFVSGFQGWRILGTGLAEFDAASIRGKLSADRIGTGTISVGTDITLNGEINAGDFTGYAWPPAGAEGFHLSGSGLLIGDYYGTPSTASFFQVDRNGSLSTHSLRLDKNVCHIDGEVRAGRETATTGTGVFFGVDPLSTQWVFSAGTAGDEIVFDGLRMSLRLGKSTYTEAGRSGLHAGYSGSGSAYSVSIGYAGSEGLFWDGLHMTHKLGQSAFRTGVGMWVDWSGAYRISIGNGTTSGLSFDGGTLALHGPVVADGNLATGAVSDIASASASQTLHSSAGASTYSSVTVDGPAFAVTGTTNIIGSILGKVSVTLGFAVPRFAHPTFVLQLVRTSDSAVMQQSSAFGGSTALLEAVGSTTYLDCSCTMAFNPVASGTYRLRLSASMLITNYTGGSTAAMTGSEFTGAFSAVELKA